MSQQEQHGLWAVVVDETVLGGITDLNVVTNTQIRAEPRSNEVYARFLSLIEQKPAMRFTTEAIASALGLCGVTGLDVDSLTNGLICYAQKHADGGTRASGANHRKYVQKDGLLLPRTLSCEHRGDARLNYESVVTYDSSNDPITVTENQSLPAGISDSERFTLGPVQLETLNFNSKIRLELDFGITATPEGADSDIWDTIVSISQVVPILRLRGTDPKWFSATMIPLIGKQITHANTAIYLRKRALGGTFVADATEEHIKLTMEGMAHVESILDASGNDTGQCEVIVTGRFDGTNTPVVVDTTAALP